MCIRDRIKDQWENYCRLKDQENQLIVRLLPLLVNQSICRDDEQRLTSLTEFKEIRSVLERGEELFEERSSPRSLHRELQPILSPEYFSPNYTQSLFNALEPGFPQLAKRDSLFSKSDEGDDGGFLGLGLNNEYELD
eukprot:TRINITY_DN1330_c0_g1_i5.p1 TRINITY_DN1330_c0_g1~~TRINITY_DN1330_c0_g1_i5.p1  ORF type:complete len:137 (+),score=56.41 TRINITY_DN1330_c0_g1_i5:92-502(+)